MTHSVDDFSRRTPAWLVRMTPADMARLGQSLRPINPLWLSQPESRDRYRVWYQGNEPYFDVVVEYEGDAIDWVQFTLRGKILIWQAHNNHLSTGETEELNLPTPGPTYPASRCVRRHEDLNPAFVELVLAILQSQPQDDCLSQVATLLRRAYV